MTKFNHQKKLISVNVILVILFSCFVFNSSFCQNVPVTTDSRIRTLVYNPNEVYQLKFYYGYQSFIEFSEDEEIEMISVGESFAWRLTPSGKRLFIRPLEIAAHTNMTIITNKRTYNFDISSGEYNGKADEELVYTVRFYYPYIGQRIPITDQMSNPSPTLPPIQPSFSSGSDSLASNRVKFEQKFSNNSEAKAAQILKSELNFDYSLAGQSAVINILKVYDNGEKTFFQFSNNNSIIPSISAVDEFGAEENLSYVIHDNYVIVPTVESQFTLRLGDSLICIYNNNPKARK
jgi:type IV secretion system protein VirB9